MNAKSGNTVTVHYTGTLNDGTKFDSSRDDGRNPITFTLGAGQMILGFDTAVTGMTVGEVKDVTLAPTEAYGEKRDDLTQIVPQAAFPEGFEFIVGGQVVGQSESGMPVTATIMELVEQEQEQSVKLDMNHPLSGKTLNFNIELVEIQDTTTTE